ncbi:MAG: 5-formyltetrahydrofolate cyclo-ligase [Acidobacteriota bacterium]
MIASETESAIGKTALRRQIQSRIASFDPDSARRAADQAAARILALPEVAQARRIFACLSFGGEIDTWGLVERLLAQGRQVLVPRADPETKRLHIHPYPCQLRPLSFGLRQPLAGSEEIPRQDIDSHIEVALVLGLAFDRSGFRLGHGAGYFDRFLAGRPFPAIGLAYHFQLLDRIPVEPHDVPMAVIVTEQVAYRA